MDRATSAMRLDLVTSALVALVGLACYSNSIFGGAQLVFDDLPALRDNVDVYGPGGLFLGRGLQNDYWGEAMNSSTSHKSYRPMTVFSFRANCMMTRVVGRVMGDCSADEATN